MSYRQTLEHRQMIADIQTMRQELDELKKAVATLQAPKPRGRPRKVNSGQTKDI